MKKKALLLFILRILRTGLSVINLTITAKYFGVSIERDVWLLASAAILILDQAIWGPINETFRAKFIFLQHEIGVDAAMQKTRSVFLFIIIITLLIVCVCLSWPLGIAKIIAPRYNQHQQLQLSYMLMLLSPGLLFTQLCQFLSALLNAYKKVYLPEIIGFGTALINIVAVLILAPKFGIYSLVFCYYLGLILLLAVLTLQLYKLNVRFFGNPLKFSLNDIKPFIVYALPFFVPYFFGQINLLIEKSISSTMAPGVVSVIDYSRKFSDITINVLSGIFTTILLPVLSAHYAKKQFEEFAREFKSILQTGFLVVIFLTGIFTACPMAVTELLYNRGTMPAAALNKISTLSMLYSWSAAAVFMYVIFGAALLSSNKGKIYAVYGTMAQVVMILFNLLFNKRFGVYTFPISLSLSHLLAAMVLFRYFPVSAKALFIPIFNGLSQIISGCTVLYIINKNISVNSFHPLIVISANMVLIALFVLAYAYIAKTDDRALVKKLINNLKAAFN